MSNKSNHTLNSKNTSNHTIPVRIEFIKELMKDKDLKPMVNFDNTETENFMGLVKDDNGFEDTPDSNDTRSILNKKKFNLGKIINQIGGRLEYIKSGTTGHTFKGIIMEDGHEINYAVKVVAYPKKDKYGDFVAKNRTPHIVLPICTFNTSITHFVTLIDDNVVDAKDPDGCGKDSKYADFVEKYKNGEFYDDVSILISEWANKGDFLDFMRKRYKNFELEHWKVFFFQIISVLAIIQSKFPSFRHNDLKANNILIHKTESQTIFHAYKICDKHFYVPNIGYQLKLWDFDFSCIPGIVDNAKVSSDWTKLINVTPHENKYYDMHYFFNTLIKKGFLPQILTDECVPREVKDFIGRIVPERFRQGRNVHKRGRILINDEYLTPWEVLCKDKFFAEFSDPSFKTKMLNEYASVKPSAKSTTNNKKNFVNETNKTNVKSFLNNTNLVNNTNKIKTNVNKIPIDNIVKKTNNMVKKTNNTANTVKTSKRKTKSKYNIEDVKLEDLLDD